MAYIKDIEIKNGSNSTTYLIEPTLFRDASTDDSGETYTTADLTGFELITGATVQIKFSTTNKANATLSVNSTTAASIWYNGAAISENTLKANHIYTLVYDGTSWQIVGDINTNTWRSITDSVSTTSSSISASATAVKTAYDKAVDAYNSASVQIPETIFTKAFQMLYSSAKDTPAVLDANTTSTKKFLTMTGTGSAGAAPVWGTIVAADLPESVKKVNTYLYEYLSSHSGTNGGFSDVNKNLPLLVSNYILSRNSSTEVSLQPVNESALTYNFTDHKLRFPNISGDNAKIATIAIGSGTLTDTEYSGNAATASKLGLTTTSSLNTFYSDNSTEGKFVRYTAGGGSNTVEGKPDDVTAFGCISFKCADGYEAQILASTAKGLFWRQGANASLSTTSWLTIIDSSNYKTYAWARPSTITSGQVVISSGTDGTTALRGIRNNTTTGNLGWTAQATDNTLITTNTLAYWNGRYNSTTSNLEYYKGGAFGTMAKETAANYAKLASPTFTGTPKSVTPSSDSDNKMIATKEYVDGIVAVADALVYKGVWAGAALDTANNNNYGALTPAADCGDTYKVSVAGFINGLRVEVGDMLICTTDNTPAAETSGDNIYTTVRNNWNIIQTSEGSVSTSNTLNENNKDKTLAFFDGNSGRIIKSCDHIVYYNDENVTINNATKKRNGLRFYGATYGNTKTDLTSNTLGVIQYEDGGPRLEFSESATGGTDNGAIIFTNHDKANTGGGSSFHFVGQNGSDNTGGNLAVTAPDLVARKRFMVGKNFIDSNYTFYSNGTSYINGATTINSTLSVASAITLTGTAADTAVLKFSRSDASSGYNYIEIPSTDAWLCIGGGHSSANTWYRFTSSEFRPERNNEKELGTSTIKWKASYVITYYGTGIELTPSASTTSSTASGFKLLNGTVKYANYYLNTVGTTSNVGIAAFSLGNDIEQGTSDNAKGAIWLYGTKTKATQIESAYTGTSGHSVMYFPNHAGPGYLVHTEGTTKVGDTTQPVYIAANGRVTACTSYANATVAKAGSANIDTTTNAIAYYSNGTGAFASGAQVLYLNVNGTNTGKAQGLSIIGTAYNAAGDLASGNAGVLSFGDPGPQIRFKDDTQSGVILFHRWNNGNASVSFNFLSNEGGEGALVRAGNFIANNRIYIGTNTLGTTYNLSVDGTTYLNGNTTLGTDYTISRAGKSQNWNEASKYAMIRMTSQNNWSPILALKANSGWWTMGHYHDSAYDDHLLFTFLADVDVSGTTNAKNHMDYKVRLIPTVYGSNTTTTTDRAFVTAPWASSKAAVGNGTKPVYINDNGVATACTAYEDASVNYATSAGSATNDSDGNAINTTYLKRAGGRMTGDLVLYTSGTGSTPALVFQRQDTIGGGYYDWRVINTSGKLVFEDIGTHTSNAWTSRLELYTDTLSGKFKGPLEGNADTSTEAKWLMNRGGSTVTVGDSSWTIQSTPTGYTNQAIVWHQKWNQSGLTYTKTTDGTTTTPSITNSGDILYWLSSSDTADALVINIQLDGLVHASLGYRGGGFSVTRSEITQNIAAGANSQLLRITNSRPAANISATQWFWGLDFLVSNMIANTNACHVFGKAHSNKNSGVLNYHHAGDASNSNYVGIGLYSQEDALKVYGSKQVEVSVDTASSSNSTGALVIKGGLATQKTSYLQGSVHIIGAAADNPLIVRGISGCGSTGDRGTTVNATDQGLYLNYNGGPVQLGYSNDTSTNIVTVAYTQDASSSSTGAFVVSGGAGIAKKLYVGTGVYTPLIYATHTANASDGIRIYYSTTIDFFMGVGTGNTNHGIYDNKASKWILSSDATNIWTYDGKIKQDESTGDYARPIWFCYNDNGTNILGKPGYNNNFTYNPAKRNINFTDNATITVSAGKTLGVNTTTGKLTLSATTGGADFSTTTGALTISTTTGTLEAKATSSGQIKLTGTSGAMTISTTTGALTIKTNSSTASSGNITLQAAGTKGTVLIQSVGESVSIKSKTSTSIAADTTVSITSKTSTSIAATTTLSLSSTTSTSITATTSMTISAGTTLSISSGGTSDLTITSAKDLLIANAASKSTVFKNNTTEIARFNTNGMFQINSNGTQETHRLYVNGDSAFNGKLAFGAQASNSITEKVYMQWNATDLSLDFIFP